MAYLFTDDVLNWSIDLYNSDRSSVDLYSMTAQLQINLIFCCLLPPAHTSKCPQSASLVTAHITAVIATCQYAQTFKVIAILLENLGFLAWQICPDKTPTLLIECEVWCLPLLHIRGKDLYNTGNIDQKFWLHWLSYKMRWPGHWLSDTLTLIYVEGSHPVHFPRNRKKMTNMIVKRMTNMTVDCKSSTYQSSLEFSEYSRALCPMVRHLRERWSIMKFP